MQIIAGTFRSRKIVTPHGINTRPTSGRLRETVFNICQQSVENCTFLDLCAGSGAMGLEAISRGASLAVFVDKDPQAIRAITQNIETFNIKAQTKVIYKNAVDALNQLVVEKFVFDICFIDPPYEDQKLFSSIISFLDEHPELFAKEATLFIESGLHSPIECEKLAHFANVKTRKVGDSLLYMFT